MVQLDKFFLSNWWLFFSLEVKVGDFSGIGPMRQVDHRATVDRLFDHEDPNDVPIYIEYAASSDPKSYYTHMLDRHLEQNPVPRGLVMFLRQRGVLCSST